MVIVGEFCHAMRAEMNITRNFKEKTQAYYIATTGLNQTVVELIKNMLVPLKATPGDDEIKEEISWRINADIPPVFFDQGQFKIKIDNESGKVNINKADSRLLKLIFSRFELDDSEKDVLVDSILDWRDPDKFHRLNGAEDDYYNALPEPYECKDADFDSAEELLLVKGMTPEIFYGGLKEMVTVYANKILGTSKRKARNHKLKKININAASPEILRCLPEMTDDLVLDIMEYRKNADFETLTEIIEIIGSDVYASAAQYLTLEKSPFYTIQSIGTLADSDTRTVLKVMVEIHPRFEKGYRIVQRFDG